MEKVRCYMVIDMKSFFASVECAELKLDPFKTPLVVADKQRGESTICLAVTPYMKLIGVKNRCRLFEIPKNITFKIVPPRMKKYIEYAAKIYGIYLKYIDKSDIHVYSIDECIIDATDYLKIYNQKAKQFAQMLMNEIDKTLHIPSSCGIGTNMYLAKIALDITAKHSEDRIGWLTEKKFIKELWNHKPLSDFWGISTGISARLAKLGIFCMREIAEADEDVLYKVFGVNAELLIDHSKGIETCLMEDIKNYKSQSKSFSNSQILPPPGYNYEDSVIILKEMIQLGCLRLLKENKVTSLVHVQVGYENMHENRTKITIRLLKSTSLFSEMIDQILVLYKKTVNKSRLIRQIGYDFSAIEDEGAMQVDMFTDLKKVEKEKRLLNGVLQIQDKFGKNSLIKGIDLTEKATLLERNKQIGGHRSGED